MCQCDEFFVVKIEYLRGFGEQAVAFAHGVRPTAVGGNVGWRRLVGGLGALNDHNQPHNGGRSDNSYDKID